MKRIIMPLLLLSAAFLTPAYANYFSNPALGITMNIGSAPNPTPDDIRESRDPTIAVAADPAPVKDVISSEGHKAAMGDREYNSPLPGDNGADARVSEARHKF
jgi:hypothetical protein